MISKESLFKKVNQCSTISQDIKNLDQSTLLKLMFYWNHLKKDNISGMRLTATGLSIFKQLYDYYEYENDSTQFKGKWIVILSNMLKYPWYIDPLNIVIFDKKIYCEIKLMGSFSEYMDSISTKKYF